MLGFGRVADALKATRDLETWKVLIANAPD